MNRKNMKTNRYSLGQQLNAAHDRIIRILLASSETLDAIDRVLDGKIEAARPERKGPLLMQVGEAAKLLGVHRATIRRLMLAGRLKPVQLVGAIRVRREDVEAIASGNPAMEASST